MTRNMLVLASVVAVFAAGTAQARDQIRIVGSSTVFPFSTAVAERFGKTTSFKTPVVESTGSGGGLKLFCSGVGTDTPDITNASRRIKASEVELCAKNGVTDIVEVKVGYDGIVIANSKKAARYQLTLRDVFLALAKDVPDGNGNLVPNPHKTWKDVNPALPATKIEVLGPPPTSGTRDAFVELALEGGCKTFDSIKSLEKSDGTRYKAVCHTIREDGAYVEAGENDNLIVQKLEANPDALGIFGFSFLDQNSDKVQGSEINGVVPDFDEIADGNYLISRPLYFYAKKAHVGVIPGMAEFLAEFTSDAAWGEDGYLADKGLIPMPDDERDNWRQKARGLAPLTM
ncbi:MAG: PstS family phosphate ABC transporter substrate-binding protein [Rhodospirillales bacterium]|nr:MAG: PstS family phosphate ABC transporter substrate-binding protein [Rhodospirillales bacterium]